MGDQFTYQNYVIKKKILALVGAKFHVSNPAGEIIMFSQQKALKLKEDIRIFTGEDMTTELVSIHARSIMDASAVYDIADTQTGEKIGGLKRKGMQSILQDEWAILDVNDTEIGTIKEDNMALALVRRFATNLIPQTFHITMNGKEIGFFKQNINPLVTVLNIDLSKDTDNLLDKRLGVAAGLLLCAVEGKQG
jgi:uncharacterized protein YxjI